MKWLPKEDIVYRTYLKEEELISRLNELMEPAKTFRINFFGLGKSKAYEGTIDGKRFEMKRLIGYRNSFLPKISGEIYKEYDGLKIKVKMRLHTFVVVFLIIWMSFVGIAGIASLVALFTSKTTQQMLFIPGAMLIFAYVLTMGAFKFESLKSKKQLKELFEADIQEE